MASRRGRKHGVRTLLCLLQGLEAQTTTIELRNEIKVRGVIESVDEKMKYSLIIFYSSNQMHISHYPSL